MYVRWDVLTDEQQIGISAGIARIFTAKPDLLQFNPLFDILIEFGVNWRDLYKRIPIMLKYIIFRIFSTLSINLTAAQLPLLPQTLPLSDSLTTQYNEENIEKNDEKINRTFYGDETVSRNNLIHKNENDNFMLIKSSILILLENMVKMGATKSVIGEKSVLAISVTINLILKSPYFPASSTSFSTSNFTAFSSIERESSDTTSSAVSTTLKYNYSDSYFKLLSLTEKTIKESKNEKKVPIDINELKKLNFILPSKIQKIEDDSENEYEIKKKNLNVGENLEQSDVEKFSEKINLSSERDENEIWISRIYNAVIKLF